MIQGFSGGLLNRELIYQTDLPSFQRDFASLKTLDHGTGPAINFTRASNATYFDANGVLQTASSDTPRFDHSGGSSLGLLIEEARTNSIRNSQAGGAVVGTPGTAPNNWGLAYASDNITSAIVGTGTENGLTYVDVKYSGTPNSSGSLYPGVEASNQVAAASGQVWTFSGYIKLAAGSLSGVTARVLLSERASGGGSLDGTVATITPTSASLASQRVSVTRTFNNAGTNFAAGFFEVQYTNGVQIGGSADGITLRVAAPQLEQGAFATSYIPTTTAAATRAADSAVVTPISSFYNQSEGTLFAEAGARGIGLVANPILSLHNTIDNAITTERWADLRSLATGVNAGGVRQESMDSDVDTWPFGQTVKFSFAYKVNDLARSLNGGSVAVDTTASLPSAATEMTIGQNLLGGRTNGHIRKIAYWPKRLTNTLLEQLTT
jgi:hypothetical protein